MSEKPLQVLAVVGSLNQSSMTRVVLLDLAQRLANKGCCVDILDLSREPLALFNPDTSHSTPEFPALKQRAEQADIFLLGTPDYHGSISSATKSFLDHFWHEFAG